MIQLLASPPQTILISYFQFMKIIYGIVTLFLLSCSGKSAEIKEQVNKVIIDATSEAQPNLDFLRYVLWDSTSIGIDNSFKVRMEHYKQSEYEYFINIQLFKKNHSEWKKTQELKIETFISFNIEPHFEDFNNDGYNDLTVFSGEAARAANEIRTLFIFDSVNAKFIHIRNSAEHPNLMYNPSTNSITCWHFYGGNSTGFLEIQDDSLVIKAIIEDFDGVCESTIYHSGSTKGVIYSEPADHGVFNRYVNYDPIE